MCTEIYSRFLEVFEYLHNKNLVESNASVAKKLKMKPQAFNEVLKGRTKLGVKFIHDFCIAYSISPTWLLTGEGPMLKSEEKAEPPGSSAPPQAQGAENGVISYLQQQMAEKDSKIEELNREIGRLNALVEQLKKDTNKANYAPGTSELERKK